MTSHTPGPWTLWPDDTKPQIRIVAQGCPFAFVEPIFRREGEGRIGLDAYKADYPEQAANARLIATAPELLEALRQLADYVMREEYAPNELAIKAQAIITKALGG